MDNMQRGFSCAIIIGLLAAHLANAYRSPQNAATDLFGHPHPLDEEPILKATSPKLAATTTTATHTASEANAAENALLTTIFTDLLTSTPEAPQKLEESLAASAEQGLMEQSVSSGVASNTAATTSVSTSPATAAASSASMSAEHDDDDLLPPTPAAGAPKRRIVTYDQRQEGQYNVRADLENFMIVLIPPSSMSGSLLDLLRKQQQRHNVASSQKRRKHHYDHDNSYLNAAIAGGLVGGTPGGSSKYHNPIKIGQNAQNANYLTRPTYGAVGQQAQQTYPLMPPLRQVDGGNNAVRQTDARFASKIGAASWPAEFIEGRTPYHVDISASDDEQLHLHLPERHPQSSERRNTQSQAPPVVDVLPPPYSPLAYQPFHLDVEPTLTLQALPPADVKRAGSAAQLAPATGNFLETYSQLLNSGLQAAADKLGNSNSKANRRSNSLTSGRNGGYYRVSRSILDYDFFKGNQLDSRNSVDSAQRYFYPIYRSEHSLGASQLYPPLDEPHAPDSYAAGIVDDPLSLDSTSAELEDDVELPHVDDLPLASLDYEAMDKLQAKRLLERCSPGMRRDSYGLCRKIEGY